MPISFSALCIISFVIRIGIGDGVGDGVGVGVWANVFSGAFETTSAAAPAAGRTLTKLRRLIDIRFVFFIVCSRSFGVRPSHNEHSHYKHRAPERSLTLEFRLTTGTTA